MPRILICTQSPAHWDAILPLLPWLGDAGAQLSRLRGAPAPAAAEIRAVAEVLEEPDPALAVARLGAWRRHGLLLGTVDDLPLLTRLGGETPFVAVARLPIPVTLLSSPVPPRLTEPVQAGTASPVGELLTPGQPAALKTLSERTEGLPFVVTGCSELDQTSDAIEPAGRFVILHPGDLVDTSASAEEAQRRQVRVLDRLLTPLAALQRPVEIHTALHPGPHEGGEQLAEAVRAVGMRRSLSLSRVELYAAPGWSRLASARAVLALSFQDLLRALASGTARVWYLPFVRSQLRPDAEPPVAGLTISSWARYARWVEDAGWESPSEDAKQTARLLVEPSDGRAGQRIAQVVMTVAEWDREADPAP